MTFSAERAIEDIYSRVRRKKKALDGQREVPPSEGPDPLFVEMGRGSQALSEFVAGIESNRDVLRFDLRSRIPLLGPLVTGIKRAMRRLARFYVLRQTGFNQYALEFLKVLAEQSLRLSAWAREQESAEGETARQLAATTASLAELGAILKTALAEDRARGAAMLVDERARSEEALRAARLQIGGELAALERTVQAVAARTEEEKRSLDAMRQSLAGILREIQVIPELRTAAEGQRDAQAEITRLRGATRPDLAPRLDVLVGLLSAPRDLALVARADGPVPPAPRLTRAGPSALPALDFTPLGGRSDVYRKFVAHFRGCRRVLDLGCGEQGLLPLLYEAGIGAMGVDGSAVAVASSKERGLEAVHEDLFDFLGRAEPESFDGIALTHVLEHFVPEDAFALLCGYRRVLQPGSPLLVVTPNPESYFTQMVHFWRDPSHKRPYPLPLLVKLVEAAGFRVIEAAPDQETAERWLP